MATFPGPAWRVAAGKVSPSAERVDGCLARANVSRLTAVIPVHTHIDHAMDSALVADRTGAQLVGGVGGQCRARIRVA